MFMLFHLISTLCLCSLSFISFLIIKMDLCAAVLQTSGLVLIKSRMKQQWGQQGEQCRGKQNQLYVEITNFECLLVRVTITKKGCCKKLVLQLPQIPVFDKEAGWLCCVQAGTGSDVNPGRFCFAAWYTSKKEMCLLVLFGVMSMRTNKYIYTYSYRQSRKKYIGKNSRDDIK